MKKGDLVKVNDGSWAVRVDRYKEDNSLSGNNPNTFKVVGFNRDDLQDYKGRSVLDIYIACQTTGEIYLHTSRMLTLVRPRPSIKEVTMAELEEFYGCKVKVVK